jgi:hypothetical protein
MAEAAGLVVGVVALAGLFNNTVECFEFVQLGRAFWKDFQTSQLKLDSARLRLSRRVRNKQYRLVGLIDWIRNRQELKSRSQAASHSIRACSS